MGRRIALLAMFLLVLAAQPLWANDPPPDPPAPVIIGSGTPFTNGSTAYCQNCPPYPTPLDPNGNGVFMRFAWLRNGVEMEDVDVNGNDWNPIIDSMDWMVYKCTNYGIVGPPGITVSTCALGDTLQIKAQACDDQFPSLCSNWVESNTITVSGGCLEGVGTACDPSRGWDGGCCYAERCVPDAAGGYCEECNPGGPFINPGCSSDDDCCFGMACIDTDYDGSGYCSARSIAIGGMCAEDNDCSSGLRCCLDPSSPYSGGCGLAATPCEPPCRIIGQSCPAAGDCCGGLECRGGTCKLPNRPPAPPALAPHITSIPSPITVSGVASCDANCPPAAMPPDPDGDAVHIEYLWYKNSAAIGAWGAALSSMDCASNGCAAGDAIALRARACDDQTPSLCSSEVVSNSLTVSSPPPPPPPPGPVTATNPIYPILAVVIAFAILGLAYMASYVFGMASLRAIVQDEVLQVIATGAIAAALIGANGVIDTYMVDILKATGEAVTCSDPNNATTCDKSMMGEANAVLVGMQTSAGGLLLNLGDVSTEIGREASRGIFCNFLGVGYTLVNCSQLNAFRGGLTTSAFATSTALADTYAQQFILSLARAFAFTFLLPIGLFLRCFKVSRQAGGALIAIGFGFYTAYPAVIVATDRMLHGSTPPSPSKILNFEEVAGELCDPMEVSVQESYGKYSAYASYITEFSLTENIAYFVLVRVLFTSILSLIITLGFIRALAHIIGSEIDVSSLARIS